MYDQKKKAKNNVALKYASGTFLNLVTRQMFFHRGLQRSSHSEYAHDCVLPSNLHRDQTGGFFVGSL